MSDRRVLLALREHAKAINEGLEDDEDMVRRARTMSHLILSHPVSPEPPPRTLIVAVDVTDLTEEEAEALGGEMWVQTEASDEHPDAVPAFIEVFPTTPERFQEALVTFGFYEEGNLQ